MKILIAYESKTGTTEKCVQKIASALNNVTVINLAKKSEKIIEYDIIIIGTPIRMGKINKKTKQFIKDNYKLLLKKKVAYFICCGFNDNWKKYYEQNIKKELLDSSIIYTSFGGKLDIKKQRGLDKFIVKLISKVIDKNEKINLIEENIDSFIKELQQFI